MTKAAIYARVSTQEQAQHGASLGAQTDAARAYCKMLGVSVAAVLVEKGVSGSRPLDKRPEGAKLLRMISEGEVQHVVAVKLDRLFRSARDCLAVVEGWDKKGVALHLVNLGGQPLNTASATGKFFLTVMAAAAELERNLTGERTTEVKASKKTKGETYSRTPFGYRSVYKKTKDGRKVDGRLVAEPAEQETIRRMRRWRKNGWPLRKIVAELVKRGIETKSGGQWRPSTVQYILGNGLYTGCSNG